MTVLFSITFVLYLQSQMGQTDMVTLIQHERHVLTEKWRGRQYFMVSKK